MKKTLLLSTTLLALTVPALAQEYAYQAEGQAQQALSAQEDPVMEEIAVLQKEWARIKYQVADEDQQVESLHKLEKQAAEISANYPSRAEPKIWEAIILSTDAGIDGGLGALGTVKKAKELLEEALRIDDKALEGSAHTSLGSLYYQVPGWPVAFGDDDEAEKHLKQALQINPDGIDPNFFYADFLIEDDREDEAKPYLEHALMAPNRPDRPLADAGRRQEVKAKLAEIKG